MDSLSDIIENIKPDIVVLNEIKTSNSGTIHTYFKQRKYKAMVRVSGGIAIATHYRLSMINVTTTRSKNIICGLIRGLNLRIIAGYGPQENVLKEEREVFFDDLNIEIQSCEDAGNNPLIIGDLNSKIIEGTGNNGIKGISSNRDLLRDVINHHSLTVLNFKESCVGVWTRVQSVNKVINESVLDYGISNSFLADRLDSLLIEEEKILCPFRVIKRKKNVHQNYSDHNALLFTFSMRYSDSRKPLIKENVPGWKITEEGLVKFLELTSSDRTDYLKDIYQYPELEKCVNNLMDDCFKRKRQPKPDRSGEKVTEATLKPALNIFLPLLFKGKAEKEIAQYYIAHLKELQLIRVQEQRTDRLHRTLEKLQDENGEMSVEKFWKLRKSVLGNETECTSILTEDGVEVFDEEAIINEYRKEFILRLSHRKINPSYTEYEEASNRLLDLYLQTGIEEEPDFINEEVDKILGKLKKGKAAGPDGHPPDVYKNAGSNLVEAVQKTLNHIKNTLETADAWIEMNIRTLYKNKGSRKQLKNHRGIFLTCILSKVLERLLLLRAKEGTDKINPLQTGSRTGKCTADNMFILYGLIDHSLYLNRTLFITTYDYATCFDSLWLEDCLLALKDLGVSSRIIKLVLELNKNASITVKTPCGNAPSFETQTIVKQGTVWGPKLCCASTGQLCDEDDVGGASVGCLTIHSTLYMDDCNRFAIDDINDVLTAHEKFVLFSIRKRLGLNPDKCFLLVVNKKAQTCTPTLKIGDQYVKEVSEFKTLGDYVNCKGNHNTNIEARVNSSKAVTTNMLALCNEVTIGFFRIEILLILYRSVFVQSMIFNSEAWTRLSAANITSLQTAQLKCLKRIMRTASSTPNCFLYLELGVLPIQYEIHKRKLRFLYHILSLPSSDPVHEMYNELKKYPYARNWSSEIQELLSTYNLPTNELEILKVSMETWKSTVKKAVNEVALKVLIAEAKTKKKLAHICMPTNLEMQKYLSSYSSDVATVIFKLRGRSVNCLSNRGSDDMCRLCGCTKETQEHAINCSEIADGGQYMDLRDIYGDVNVDDPKVREIVSRYNCFEEKVSAAGVERTGAEL